MNAAFTRGATTANPLLASTTTVADRDAALRGLATAMHDAAPANAASRALQISDQSVRRETLETVVQSWLKRDRDKAAEWVRDSTSIPEAWKHEWLNPAR